MVIDFTDCRVNRYKTYAGANGAKICIEYDGRQYMLKFPSEASERFAVSYKSNTVTEYLGCHIFNILGIRAQETLLGHYRIRDKIKVVVACEDLTIGGKVISDFISVKNTIVDSERHGAGTELESVLKAIEEQEYINVNRLKTFFWDMFIVDAYIGNFDRHNGNWGLLVDEPNQNVDICPVYDCGSSFFPAMDTNTQKAVMSTKNDLYYHTYVIPRSALMINHKKLKYYDFMISNRYPDCTQSLLKIASKIDEKFPEIEQLIENLDEEIVSADDKNFYRFLIHERKEKLIDKAVDVILENFPEYRQENHNETEQESTLFFL